MNKRRSSKAGLLTSRSLSHLYRTEPATGTPSIEQPEHPASNKYRKVVESVILMNRLAVERAKEESDRHPTAKRRHFDTELRRWHIDSDDTATWLYTLVFTSGVPSRSSNTNGKNLAERSVTVEDYDSDASTRGNADIEVVEEDEPNSLQIVWTEQTNPDVVVDRLLDSWTKLTSDQVKDSGRVAQIEGKDETWGAELVHTLKERNKKRESKKSKKVRYSAPPVVPDSGFITAPETADGISEDEISDNPQKEQWVRGRDGIFRPKTAPQRTAGTKSTRFNPMSTEYVGPNPPSQFNPTARDCANLPPNPAQYQQTPPWGQPGPHPGLYGPWGAPPGGTIPGYPLPPTNAPQDTFGPSPQSLPKETPAPPPATSSPVETTTDYKKLQSTLERVIERLEDAEDEDEIANKKILSKVEDMIANSSAKRTEPSSQPTAEGAHEAVPEETRIRKLEEMLLELQDRQQKLAHDEVAWKAEKLLADAKALRASEEAKAATQRDLDKVRKAKKADNKTKRIDQQHLADVKAAVERRSTEEELKQEIASCKEMHFAVSNRLEQFMELHGYNNGQVSSAQLDTSEGSQKLSLPGFSNVSRASNLTEPSLKQALGPRTSLSDVPKTDPLQQINLTSLPRTNSAIFLGVPGRGHTDNSGDNGNLIVFPPIAPTSLKSIQLQSRLSKRGVLAKQEEVYTQTDDTSSVTAVSSARRLVQCTIFWEPPTVTMGSELVKTLQLRGWKPFYIRMSGEYISL